VHEVIDQQYNKMVEIIFLLR